MKKRKGVLYRKFQTGAVMVNPISKPVTTVVTPSNIRPMEKPNMPENYDNYPRNFDVLQQEARLNNMLKPNQSGKYPTGLKLNPNPGEGVKTVEDFRRAKKIEEIEKTKRLQEFLNTKGAGLRVDGVYGPKTGAADEVIYNNSGYIPATEEQLQEVDRYEDRDRTIRFQKGGTVVGHERGRPVLATVRNVANDREVLDAAEQGLTDSSLIPKQYSNVDGQLNYEMNPISNKAYYVDGVPQTVAGREVPSPSGAIPAAVPNRLQNRFNTGDVLNGVQTFNFKDPQFRGKYNRGQIQQMFLKNFFESNPNLPQVSIDGQIYRRQ